MPLACFGHVDERWVRVRGEGPVVGGGRGKGLGSGTRSQAVHLSLQGLWVAFAGKARDWFGEKECCGFDWAGLMHVPLFLLRSTAGWMDGDEAGLEGTG